MRIIAGELGGRHFDAPRGHKTHPMSDKVRGALFNILGDITDLTMLDAFAGSGAISFEAVSRGLKYAVAIDSDKIACQTIRDNVHKLGLNNEVKAIRANVSGWSEKNSGEEFDLVINDPPFNNLQSNLLTKLTHHTKKGGIFVLNWPGKSQVLEFEGLEQIERRSYGDTQLIFYKKL